jgi:hypothetical protein
MNEPVLDPARSALLDLRLDTLRHGLREHAAPLSIEARLAGRFRARHRARRRLAWVASLSLAAAIVAAAWILRPVRPVSSHVLPAVAQDNNGPFLALRPLKAIALERGATVVSAQFPRALLAEWGLPVAPDRAAEPVHAEMLYSAAGEPLAVRLVR